MDRLHRLKDEWEKITEDSPPWDGVAVLVYHKTCGVWISSRKHGKSNRGMPMDGHDWYLKADKWPTHWMPLPEIPDA